MKRNGTAENRTKNGRVIEMKEQCNAKNQMVKSNKKNDDGSYGGNDGIDCGTKRDKNHTVKKKVARTLSSI